jgi:hypothetical protein
MPQVATALAEFGISWEPNFEFLSPARSGDQEILTRIENAHGLNRR